jgi:hypothetical protein
LLEVLFGTPSAVYSAKMKIRGASIAILVVSAGIHLSFAHSNSAMTRSQDQPPKTEPKEKADPKGQTVTLTVCGRTRRKMGAC